MYVFLQVAARLPLETECKFMEACIEMLLHITSDLHCIILFAILHSTVARSLLLFIIRDKPHEK
jgi:hypothetical protein